MLYQRWIYLWSGKCSPLDVIRMNEMRWIAVSIVLAALILSYAITLPFRDCVSAYITKAGGDDVSTRATAAWMCHMGRG